jgi:hypothetical protein
MLLGEEYKAAATATFRVIASIAEVKRWAIDAAKEFDS